MRSGGISPDRAVGAAAAQTWRLTEKIRGLNLGGWLVLEPWMTPYLFPSVADYDETRLAKETPPAVFSEVLENHFKSWITKDDFRWIRDSGANLVRIPYPWWVFGDIEPYRGSVEYLDRAMDWAEACGLGVMLDLHTAPGCQNGFDNGGIRGVIDWPKDPRNIAQTVDVLERVARRYAGHAALHSFGILNEPIGSIDIDIVRNFYIDAERRLRPILADLPLVYHDSFRADSWGDFFAANGFGPSILDVHLYQCFGSQDLETDLASHLGRALVWRREFLAGLEAKQPTIVGEWSLGLGGRVARDYEGRDWDRVHRLYADAQVEGMADCSGWIFWSYKVADQYSGWNFRELYNRKVFDSSAFRGR